MEIAKLDVRPCEEVLRASSASGSRGTNDWDACKDCLNTLLVESIVESSPEVMVMPTSSRRLRLPVW